MPLPDKKTVFARTLKDHILLLFGPPGVGKTTCANNFGRTLILSTDRGTRYLNALRIECLRWKDFEKVADELEKPNAPKYDFIAIDHVDDFANMAEEKVCRDLGIESLSDAGFGKGWKAYRQAIDRFVRRIMRLGTGVVFIAHEDIKVIKTRSVELNRTMPMLSKTAWRVIVPLADVVAYCGYRTIHVVNEKGVKKRKEIRTIETEPREDLYAKDRTTRVKPAKGWAPLDGEAFMATFEGESPDTSNPEENDHGQEQEQQAGERPRGRRARN